MLRHHNKNFTILHEIISGRHLTVIVCIDVCVVVVGKEGGQDVPDLLLAGVGRDGAGRDLAGREVSHEHLQLGQAWVVGVTNSVIAASLQILGDIINLQENSITWLTETSLSWPALSRANILVWVKYIVLGLIWQTSKSPGWQGSVFSKGWFTEPLLSVLKELLSEV